MGKSIAGVLLVLGGALAGLIGSAVLFAVVFSVLGRPDAMEGAGVFGLTFGLISGVGLAFAAMENVIEDNDVATLALPVIAGILLAGLGVAVLLFGDNSWSKMFGEGGAAFLAPWAALCGWIGTLASKKK